MKFSVIKDYKENESYRKSFNELAKLVFGIDFEHWYRLGFWNERYVCYSMADEGRVVSNVSVNMLDLVIQGGKVPAIQIGTVMTHPDYRKKGLAGSLLSMVLDEYRDKCDIVFLFGNPDAEGFYRRFGFNTVKETCFYASFPYKQETDEKGIGPENAGMGLSLRPNKPSGARRLNMSDMRDVEILRRLLDARTPLSTSFDTERTEGILAWHCLNVFPEDIYYLEALDTITIYRLEQQVLHLYDVISKNKPDYCEIIRESGLESMPGEIVFHFTPETDSIPIKYRRFDTNEYIFFTMSDKVHLSGAFFYPYTAHA